MIGTLTFFNEIEYINPLLRSPMERFVTLSPLGIPVSGLHREMGITGGVGNPGLNILVAIGRAARMGRFIRTTVIVEYAAKLNLAQYFYPRFWYGLLHSRKKKLNKDRKMQDTNRSSNSSMLRMTSGSNLRVEKEPEPHQRQFFQDLAAAVGITNQASEEHVRRSQDMDAYMSARQKRKKKMGQYSRDSSSHVGAAMRELTGQRVAVGVMLAILLNIAFTYKENDGTPVMTMILLHGQTRNEKFANKALNIARSSVVPNLFAYQRYNETDLLLSESYQLDSGRSFEDIRVREILNISISSDIADTYGMFDNRDHITGGAMTVSSSYWVHFSFLLDITHTENNCFYFYRGTGACHYHFYLDSLGCWGNCICWPGKPFVLRATRDIKPSNQIYISYTRLLTRHNR